MLVTEGMASWVDRMIYAIMAPVLFACALLVFIFLPATVAPVLYICFVFAAATVARYLVLSIVARLTRKRVSAEATRFPSLVFIIPCLNELPSLKRTIPGMTEIEYEGELVFCYVCEIASTDGTVELVRSYCRRDARVVLIEKHSAPSGRGAAISYGLAHAPRCDVVAFLDADHAIDQDSVHELGRVFGQEEAPVAVQGVCASANESRNWLTRLLSIERRWLELTELTANPRLGGISHFGGGQGFLRRSLFDDRRIAVDNSMSLDDTDLSCALVLQGYRVIFNPDIRTTSVQPESLTQFIDQRYRWARGWLQVCRKYFSASLKHRGMPLGLRANLLRFAMLPYAIALLYPGLAAAAAALIMGAGQNLPLWLKLSCAFWPFLMGFQPYVAGASRLRLRQVPLTLIGIPMLFFVYSSFCAVSLFDAYVLRRKLRYSKTQKTA